jgi:hypothetical protein
MNKTFLAFLAIALILGTSLVIATNQTTRVTAALDTLKGILCGFFGALITALIVLAAISYAAGNIMGAETGARAKVWATNMIIGAAIGVVLYIVAPIVLQTLSGSNVGNC